MEENAELEVMEEKEGKEGGEDGEGIAMELLRELKTQNRRLVTVLYVVLFLWAATTGAFVWYLNQYDFTSYTVDSQDGGNANFIGNDGDITNGEGTGNQEDEEVREIKGDGN